MLSEMPASEPFFDIIRGAYLRQGSNFRNYGGENGPKT